MTANMQESNLEENVRRLGARMLGCYGGSSVAWWLLACCEWLLEWFLIGPN